MFSVHPDLLYPLPDDFPTERYVAALRFLRRVQSDDKDVIARVRHCGLGLNGIAYRFRLFAEMDLAFTDLIRQFGNNPPHDQYVQRANQLFIFFLAGQAAVESLVYGVHAMPAAASNPAFRVETIEEQQDVKLGPTVKLLRASYPSAAITASLGSLLVDKEYMRWQGIRNLVAHRHHPGETVRVSFGGQPVPVEQLFEGLETPGRPRQGIPNRVEDVILDENTTEAYRQWLSGLLGRLVDDVASFAELLFGHLPIPS